MNRNDWHSAIMAVLSQETAESTDTTLNAYNRLIRRLRRELPEQASEWELGEALSLRAFFLERQGRLPEALRGYLDLARFRRGFLLSYGHSLASALESAAALADRAGRRRTAVKLAQEVIGLRAQYPYAGEGLQHAVRILTAEQRRRSDIARRKQLVAAKRRRKR